MCGHCRTIVAGAFVVGGLVGFLASNVLLNKKYKAIYEAESEKTVEAGKRVVKGLKEKLAKYEATEEEYRQKTEEYISEVNVEVEAEVEVAETESEKIPEGKSGEATRPKAEFIKKGEFEDEWPENWHKGCLTYIRDANVWLEKGEIVNEAGVIQDLGSDILRELYKTAGTMRKPRRTLYVQNWGDMSVWQVDLYQSDPRHLFLDGEKQTEDEPVNSTE